MSDEFTSLKTEMSYPENDKKNSNNQKAAQDKMIKKLENAGDKDSKAFWREIEELRK